VVHEQNCLEFCTSVNMNPNVYLFSDNGNLWLTFVSTISTIEVSMFIFPLSVSLSLSLSLSHLHVVQADLCKTKKIGSTVYSDPGRSYADISPVA
jgi:hypothetical protein